MPERITRAEIEDQISDNQVETLWSLPFERLIAKGLEGAALLEALTRVNGPSISSSPPRGRSTTAASATCMSATTSRRRSSSLPPSGSARSNNARFFDEVIGKRQAIEREPVLEEQFTDRFYDLSTHAGDEHLYTLTPLVLAYADRHPGRVLRPVGRRCATLAIGVAAVTITLAATSAAPAQTPDPPAPKEVRFTSV